MSPASALPDIAAAFGHVLHRSGVSVTPEQSGRFGTAVTLARPDRIGDLYWIGRVTLLTGHDQIETYDRVFAQVFGGIVEFDELRSLRPQTDAQHESAPVDGLARERVDNRADANPGAGMPSGALSEAGREQDESASVLAAASVEERLGDKDFAECTDDELALIRSLVERLPLVPPQRIGRRTKRSAHGRRLDVRQTLRRAHRTAGDPVDLVLRQRKTRPRRVVLIADVSGSMEAYARVYLHLLRGAVQSLHAEAFVFATRLTRLTRPLAISHPDVAYLKATRSAPDWSGGTRIGQALTDFVDDFGRRGMARGAVIVIVSDGWEVDSSDRVAESMARLSRLAHHVIWVNPRKAAESYEPLAGGMAAALPYVDTFVSGHSVHALEEVLEAVRGATERSREDVARRRVAP